MYLLRILAAIPICLSIPAFADNSRAGFKNISLGDEYTQLMKDARLRCYAPVAPQEKRPSSSPPQLRHLDEAVIQAYEKTQGDYVCYFKGDETIAGLPLAKGELTIYEGILHRIKLSASLPSGYGPTSSTERDRLVDLLIIGLTQKYGHPVFHKYVRPEDRYTKGRFPSVTLSHTWRVGPDTIVEEHRGGEHFVTVVYTSNLFDLEHKRRLERYQQMLEQRDAALRELKDADARKRMKDF